MRFDLAIIGSGGGAFAAANVARRRNTWGEVSTMDMDVMPRKQLMTVGELSRRTGTPVKALREYTDAGLINTPGRSPTGYRLFDTDALWCVRWIHQMRAMGFTLAQLRHIAAGCRECDQQGFGQRLAQQLDTTRERLDTRIAELQHMRRRLEAFETAHGIALRHGQAPAGWTNADRGEHGLTLPVGGGHSVADKGR